MGVKFNVMCMTWNLEGEKPDVKDLESLFKQAQSGHNLGLPDIIAIGIQEGNSKDHQPILEAALKGYKCVASAKFSGITKAKQIWTFSPVTQGIFLMIRLDAFNAEKEGKADNTSAAAEAHSKKLFSEKGYVFGEITYNGYRLGFVSTHAETRAKKKAGDFATISKGLQKIVDDSGEPFHAVFVMGDLNYRLNRTFDIDPKNPKDPKDPKTAARIDDFYQKMATPHGRVDLLTEDSFTKESAKIPNLKMEWPAFSPQCLPTYKRKRDKEGAKLLEKLKKESPKHDKFEYNPEVLKDLYSLTMSDKGGAQWDCGWLDRIGFDIGGGGPIVAKGLTHTGCTPIQGGNLIKGGDHIPVWINMAIEVPDKK